MQRRDGLMASADSFLYSVKSLFFLLRFVSVIYAVSFFLMSSLRLLKLSQGPCALRLESTSQANASRLIVSAFVVGILL